MKQHLIFLNGVACVYLILFAPVAVRKNADAHIDQMALLKESGVIDQTRLEAFADSIGKPEIAIDSFKLANWLTDSSATNYVLVFPSFMVFLFNTMFLLRMWLRELPR